MSSLYIALFAIPAISIVLVCLHQFWQEMFENRKPVDMSYLDRPTAKLQPIAAPDSREVVRPLAA